MNAAEFESAFLADTDIDPSCKADEANDAWRGMGRRRFEAAYGPEDCVYEEPDYDARAADQLPMQPTTTQQDAPTGGARIAAFERYQADLDRIAELVRDISPEDVESAVGEALLAVRRSRG